VLVACATSITAVAVAGPVRWDANGHYYQAVPVGTPISWDAANEAAKALGPGWHLATITSEKEDAFVRSLFDHPTTPNSRFWSPYDIWDDFKRGPWIGGYRVVESKAFQWVNNEPVLFTDLHAGFFIKDGLPISYSYNVGWAGTVDWLAHDRASVAPIAYIAELSAPPAHPGLVLKRTTVAGCTSVTGRVNISNPAPAGGLVVSLSDTLDSASTPASLKIPAGATGKSFRITTKPVQRKQTGTISATFGGETFSRQLIVRPIGMASLTLSARHVVGGTKVIGTAKLECEAGPGPVTVRLGSTQRTFASPVGGYLVIPQGVQSETFEITTSAVAVPYEQYAWIFGKANNITRSRLLHLTP
jgi:hypothetical protein